ncbi:uncharacterized protein LOC127244801 [Andrographis paniculata]|uniref:uncharacterized protein LOC127244801 n=1 Tax=Andrographis paniculata TaxID=175694 RepID=UPI0021E7398B|nr:uncharacterized protein LOC127244801 [Andrographis paniculata]
MATESKTERKKRKPLADITNDCNLIPISALRELVAASSNPNLRPKPPTSILKSVSTSTTSQKKFSQLSNKSDASVGSLKRNSAHNSRTVQFQNPPRAAPSSINLGGRRNKGAAYNKKQITEKDSEGEVDVLVISPTPVEKRKDKGKAIDVQFNSSVHRSEVDVRTSSRTPVEKRKDKENAIDGPLSLSPCESEADVLISSSIPVEKRKDRGKGVDVPSSLSHHESKVDALLSVDRAAKRKAISQPFGSFAPESETDIQIVGPTPWEKMKDKGKAIDVSFSLSPYESEAAVQTSSPSLFKKRKGTEDIATPYSSPIWESEADLLVSSPSPVERRKDKGKAIYVESSPTPTERRRDKGKAIDVTFSSSPYGSEADVQTPSLAPVEKREDKGKAIYVPLIPTPTEKRKDKGKAIIDVTFSSSPYDSEADVQTSSLTPPEMRKDKDVTAPFSSSTCESEADVLVSIPSPVEKRKDKMEDSCNRSLRTSRRLYRKAEKGKAVLNSSISSMGALEVTEKATTNHSSCSNEGENGKYEGNARPSVSFNTNMQERGKESILLSGEKAKENRNNLDIFSSLLKETRHKGEVIHQPSDTVGIAKRNESSGSLTVGRRLLRRRSGKGKNDVVASSCPPITRTKNLRNDIDEVKSSNSYTDPRPKSRKRRLRKTEPISELPQDFIEQQKAYFKEVDEFELPEEEVSNDELD